MLSLSNVLKVNSISSGVTGIVLLVMPQLMAGIMGVPTTLPVIFAGVFLVLFALFVFEVSLGKPLNAKRVKVIIGLDISWIIASAGILVFFGSALSVVGVLIVLAVALWVAAMVYLQRRGLGNETAEKRFS